MEVIDDAGRKYRGKMGNLIYYTVNGKTYVRRARKRPGRQGKPRTEKQKALSGRFRLVQKVYSFYMQTVSADIWRIAARAQGRRGQNLFCEVNSGCFEACRGGCRWKGWAAGGSARRGRTSGSWRGRRRATG